MKCVVLTTVIFATSVPQQTLAEDSFTEREFATKKQVFGIKYPWEMTTPYPDRLPPQQSKVIIDGSPWIIQTAPMSRSSGIDRCDCQYRLSGKRVERPKFPSNTWRDSAIKAKCPSTSATLVERALQKLTENPPNAEAAKQLLRQSLQICPDSGLEHELSFLDSRKHTIDLQRKNLPDDATYLYRYLGFRQKLSTWQAYQKERYGIDPQGGFIAPPSSTPFSILTKYTVHLDLEYFSPYFNANIEYVPLPARDKERFRDKPTTRQNENEWKQQEPFHLQ